jgi:hypothetical protein
MQFSSSGDAIIDSVAYTSDGFVKVGAKDEVTIIVKHVGGIASIPTDPILLVGYVYWRVKCGFEICHGKLISFEERLSDFLGKVRNPLL